MKLSDYFTSIAYKRLRPVEADWACSNQHELNGTRGLKTVFGTGRKVFEARFLYLTDDQTDPVTSASSVTWYDSRERHPTRSEYRLYYPSNSVTEKARPGDLLVIGLTPQNRAVFLVARAQSTAENQLIWLFELNDEISDDSFGIIEKDRTGNRDLDFIARLILDQAGLVVEAPQEEHLDIILSKFPYELPPTRVFSAFAREQSGVTSHDDPDGAVIAWMETEERFFRAFEKHIVSKRIGEGFPDVDSFMAFSLSVQNRRKARAGSAFENHLEQIFIDNEIRYSRGKITENTSRPDFIFPTIESYHEVDFPEVRLTMLGAKTTCKDRWRQVLAEAKRIKEKHLATLEPAISTSQLSEMSVQKVQLVVPRAVHATYFESHRGRLMSLRQFIELLKDRQNCP